jgi:hypothetical protein
MRLKQTLHTFSTEHTDQVYCFDESIVFSLFTQVWDVKYNDSGSRLVSVGEDKLMNVYSIPA